MAAEALAAAAPVALEGLKWAYNNRDSIKKGLDTGIRVGRKYIDAIKPLANNLLTVRGRKKSAAALYDKIRNPVKTAKQVSKYIASGKAGKLASDVAGDIHQVLGAAEQITGSDFSKHKSLVDRGHQKFSHYHDVLNKYNTDISKSLK